MNTSEKGEPVDSFFAIVEGLVLGESGIAEYETILFETLQRLQDALVDHMEACGPIEGTGEETVPQMELLEHLMQRDFDVADILHPGDNVRLSGKGFVIFLTEEGDEALGQLQPNMCVTGKVERLGVGFAPVDQGDHVLEEGITSLPDQVSIVVELSDAKKVFTSADGKLHEDHFGSHEESYAYVPLIYSKMKVQRLIVNADQPSE